MKSTLLKPLTFIFAFGLLTTCFSCQEDDDDSTVSPKSIENVVNTVNTGTWKITLYEDSGQNKTNTFAGYNFTFAGSNVLTATNGSSTYNGTWSVTNSNNPNDDNPKQEDIDFNIFFSAPPSFEELSDDWDIQSRTTTEIKLIDISGGNGGTDYLTFTKN